MAITRAESVNQYISDVNSGIDTVIAWRNHKSRVGELAAYEAKLTRAERQRERKRASASEREFRKAFTPNRFGEYA